MQFQEDIISPSSCGRKAAWSLALCGRDGLWHTQGTGGIIGSVSVTVQTVQGLLLLLLPGQRVSWQHPSSQEPFQGRSEQQR